WSGTEHHQGLSGLRARADRTPSDLGTSRQPPLSTVTAPPRQARLPQLATYIAPLPPKVVLQSPVGKTLDPDKSRACRRNHSAVPGGAPRGDGRQPVLRRPNRRRRRKPAVSKCRQNSRRAEACH